MVLLQEGDFVKVGGPLVDIDSPDVDDSHPPPSQTSSPSHEEPKAEETHKAEESPPAPSSKVGELNYERNLHFRPWFVRRKSTGGCHGDPAHDNVKGPQWLHL